MSGKYGAGKGKGRGFGGGRPRTKATEFQRGQVAVLAEGGVPQHTIARKLKMHIDVLRREFEEELKAGSQMAGAEIVGTIYAIATGKIKAPVKDRLRACMCWANNVLGWRHKQAIEVTGAGGGPIDVIETVIVDPKRKG